MMFVFFRVRTPKIFLGQLHDFFVDLHRVDLHLRIVVFVEVDHGPAAEADDQTCFCCGMKK